MKILDDAGNERPPGVVGEICCGPAEGSDVSVAVEYFANPEASQRKLRDGWNRSGDMGHADAAGWLFFDYRKGGESAITGISSTPATSRKWWPSAPWWTMSTCMA